MKKTILWMLCLAFSLPLAVFPASAFDMPDSIVPGGHTIGVKITTKGLLIIGMAPVTTEKGETAPAADAGLVAGDIVIGINNSAVSSIDDLLRLMEDSGGKPVTVRYLRDGKEMKTKLKPALSQQDGKYKFGAWVRDSMAGIGTVTFYDPASGLFGALGHGINDTDTGMLLPIDSGHILYSEVESVRAGQPGSPGELRGEFRTDKQYGSLNSNTESGVFGFMETPEALGPDPHKPVPVGCASDVKAGRATILSNIAGDEVKEYEIEITKIYPADGNSRSFMIKVTDQALISVTGGIVQGMSGSPVLQGGKLVGAVTHVLVNDPKRGYGIFIEHMLAEGEKTAELDAFSYAA